MNKLISSFVAITFSLVFAAPAFADSGIPESAFRPAIKFGQNVKVKAVAPKLDQTGTKKAKEKATVAKASAPGGSKISCLSGTGANSYTISWVKEDNGSCPGKILASDATVLANLAASGKTSFKVAFYIPSKCPSGWAKMPVKVSGNSIKLYPWRKSCTNGYFNAG